MTNIEAVLNVLEKQLPEIDDKFRWINCGGCGCMAEIIACELDKLMVNYDVVCKGGYSFRNGVTLSNREVNTRIDNHSAIPNTHILIKVAGRYFDSTGEKFLDDEEVTALIDRPTVQRMNDLDCWNPSFNRDQLCNMRHFAEKVFERNFGG